MGVQARHVLFIDDSPLNRAEVNPNPNSNPNPNPSPSPDPNPSPSPSPSPDPNQIVIEAFVEDINNILNSGEVPNLF